eukprot:COSAG02_NODE_1869_length_10591_cov_184.261056_9_plen_49_part_00
MSSSLPCEHLTRAMTRAGGGDQRSISLRPIGAPVLAVQSALSLGNHYE